MINKKRESSRLPAQAFGLDALTITEAKSIFSIIRAYLRKESLSLPDDIDQNRLWHYCEAHGISPLLGKMCMESKLHLKDEAFANHRYLSNVLHNEKAIQICQKIASIARRKNINLVMLKGVALLEQAYGDQGLRSFGDIDLFFPSRAEVLAFLEEMGFSSGVELNPPGLMARLRNPGKVHVEYEGWTLELMYPPKYPTDAMQEILSMNDLIYKVPGSYSDFSTPEESFHFVFLLLHMSINHFCARLIWFVDIVVFYQANKGKLDWKWISDTLEKLEMAEISNEIFLFCNRELQSNIPVLISKEKWKGNYFIKHILNPSCVVSGYMGVQYASCFRRHMIYSLYIFGFYLIEDKNKYFRCKNAATKRTVARLFNALGVDNIYAICFFQWVAYFILKPISWIIDKSFLLSSFKKISLSECKSC